MNDQEIYEKILFKLYDSLSKENHNIFKNNKYGEKNSSLNNHYPDLILTRKSDDSVAFIIEIPLVNEITIISLEYTWKPLSHIGPSFYILVPKNKYQETEELCIINKVKARIGTYSFIKNEIELKF